MKQKKNDFIMVIAIVIKMIVITVTVIAMGITLGITPFVKNFQAFGGNY